MQPSNPGISAFLRLLREHDVEAVVIGGVAAVALGVPYSTVDVDVVYRLEEQNLTRLVEVLRTIDARLSVARMTDQEARQLPFHIDARSFQDNEALTLQTDLGRIDLLKSIPGVGDYDAVHQAAVEAEVFGIPFLVLDLPGLIANKRAVARPKDLAVLPLIEATLRARQLDESD